LLPHQHHGELSDVEHEVAHKEADSLLDYIRLVLHEDLGDGHLEHIVVGQDLVLTLDSDFTFAPSLGVKVFNSIDEYSQTCRNTKGAFVFFDTPPQSNYLDAHALRGPPVLS
jgi:hypothetical protein